MENCEKISYNLYICIQLQHHYAEKIYKKNDFKATAIYFAKK